MDRAPRDSSGRFRGLSGALLVFALLLSVAVPSLAQETTGAIRGTVTDPTGAAVPGASVEAASPALVRAQTTTTDEIGRYTFPALPPGVYTISVTATGFRVIRQSDIVLQVGRLLTIDTKLEVGQVTESVLVTSSGALIDVAASSSSTNVNVSFFDALPKSRSFDALIELAPGARREPKQGGFQIDGASGSENVYVIDGVEVTDLQTGVLPTSSRIPMEFVNELQIKSSGFEAQYGGATGGVVNTVIRSGANSFHGQASLYYETDNWNAGPRPSLRIDPIDDNFANYFHNTRDELRFLNPGGSVSGPIAKDKLWFFASYFPAHWKYNREVTFLVDGSTRPYEQNIRQDWLTGKLDFAPFSKLRAYASYVYSPYKVNGLLPTQQGTDTPDSPWADRGSRRPGSTWAGGADFTATSKLIFSLRGGHNYRNYKDYGIPRGTRYRYANSNANLPPDLPVPPQYVGPAGNFTADNRQTTMDIQTRWNLSADVTYLATFAGQHDFKFGYQTNRLHNEANAGTWPDGYIFMYWNRTRTGITVPGTMRGTYGYYIDRFFATTGDVSSDNQSFYIQDGWNIVPRLRLNLGVRFEREFLPTFRSDIPGIASRPIEFGFGEKAAPRVGAAFDVFGNGKFKLYGSFGLFYDMMKYEMPRGSFGGDVWKDSVYPLNTADVFSIKPQPVGSGANLFEVVDWRIPSNDPSDNTIEPNLMPMRDRVYDVGVEYAITSSLIFNGRYVRKVLDRTIEDVGILTPQGEKYFIANPGFGITADPATWGEGIPVTPRAKRDYDAMELRLDHRFARNLTFQASYTYSRLWGNYGGLASSDEDGRTSPNVNRYFDLPFMSYDDTGHLVYGRLATDRPHAFKFFGTYALNSKLGETRFSPILFVLQGTPVTTEVEAVSTVPVFVNGRGDLGRTPTYSNLDFAFAHEFRFSERYRAKFNFEIFNIFNQSTVTSRAVNYIHPNDGGYIAFEHEADFFQGFDWEQMRIDQGLRVDPRYRLSSAFQGPRTMRMGLHFIF